jgi:serine/threonine protein phosphatase 1
VVFGALRRVIGEWEARLFGDGELRRDEAAAAQPAQVPERVYAVGDVHGRADLLEDLYALIVEDARAAPDEPTTLVFLGDLVDRGPDSAKVVERVMQLRAESAFRVQVLKGNHEQAMLLFLDDPAFGSTWLQHGGGPTLASYGVYPPAGRGDEAAWSAVRDAFAEAVPPAHVAFLRSLPLYLERGDYLFVHAGVRPGVPLERQTEQDLLWIRQEFLSRPKASDRVVVHGHTPSETPQLTRWRIGIDTGAYATGVLSAVRLWGADQSVLQARKSQNAGLNGQG